LGEASGAPPNSYPLGLHPDPVPPNSLAAFKGPTSNGSGREREGQGREGKEREGKERKRRGEGTEERTGSRIQLPPWALQNLGLDDMTGSECNKCYHRLQVLSSF